jgi:N6-adenosine-specific RNA methylase IME4
VILPIPRMPGGWPTLYADPPWMERGSGKVKRGADRHYPLMHTDEIAGMGVGQVAARDAHLWLWATNNHLPDALWVMAAWGFRFVTVATWAKDRIGLGFYLRGQTEQLLFGVRGATRRGGQGTTLITAPRRKHSQKPAEARQLVERISPGPRLELFAREAAPGWTAWGNQAPTGAA